MWGFNVNEDKGFLGGVNDLADELAEILKQTDDNQVERTLEIGAEELAKDISRLPKPRSQISTSGYTHILDTVSTWKDDLKSGMKVRVGWKKYYGPILEHGSSKMASRPHLKPTWNRNKNKYQEQMIKYLKLGGN
jgi:HK97 gp10 family phage protein